MTDHLPAVKPNYSLRPTSLDDAAKIAKAMAVSGLFGFKTPEQALSIMLLADAEGLHPAAAARDYHVIEGRPTLKADAMLARFQQAGGKVEWHERSERIVRATFTHEAGGSLTVEWTMERANNVKNKYGKPITEKLVWKNYPAQMLTARCISEGVRTVYPGVMNGFYAPEEFDAVPGMAPEDQPPVEQLPPPPPPPPPAPEPADEKQVAKNQTPTEKIISEIENLVGLASIEAFATRKASQIARFSKDNRDKIQAAIRAAREKAKEAAHIPEDQMQGSDPTDPGPTADYQDAEFEEHTEGPFSDDDLPPPGTSAERAPPPPEEEVAPQSAVERFEQAMMEKIKMAPNVEKLDAMWGAHTKKLGLVKKESREAWKRMYEAKQERARVLEEFEAENA